LHLWKEGWRVYELARRLFPDVLAITGAVMDCAKQLVDNYDQISARDAVDAAVVAEYKLVRGCRRVAFVE